MSLSLSKKTIKDRTGYVFEVKGKWYARVTLTDNSGKVGNIKQIAKTKSDANNESKKYLLRFKVKVRNLLIFRSLLLMI
jgi:uncharacterized metal-binding protein YceD (DUF177 family)